MSTDPPSRLIERHVSTREELLHSKPPFILRRLIDKPNTKLPFLHISASAYPVAKGDDQPGQRKLTAKQDFEGYALYDTGAETTRICADILGVDFQPGEAEGVYP